VLIHIRISFTASFFFSTFLTSGFGSLFLGSAFFSAGLFTFLSLFFLGFSSGNSTKALTSALQPPKRPKVFFLGNVITSN
jgi:hypothetical protein